MNPASIIFMQVENLRCFIVGRIRTIQTLDGQTVTPEEASEAIRCVVSSHLTMATLLNHTHANITPLPSLSMMPVAQTPTNQLLHLGTPSTECYDKVCAVQ